MPLGRESPGRNSYARSLPPAGAGYLETFIMTTFIYFQQLTKVTMVLFGPLAGISPEWSSHLVLLALCLPFHLEIVRNGRLPFGT